MSPNASLAMPPHQDHDGAMCGTHLARNDSLYSSDLFTTVSTPGSSSHLPPSPLRADPTRPEGKVVAHLTQVDIVEPLQVRVVDAIGVDVGVRREGGSSQALEM